MNEVKGILFVEDHPFQQTVLVKLAKAQGLQAHVVSTAAAALREISTTDMYKVVVMDRNIKGEEDGLACTEQIRALDKQRGRHTVIIGLSADSAPKDRQACLDAGMDDFYSKPMSPDKLQEILKRWLPETSQAE